MRRTEPNLQLSPTHFVGHSGLLLIVALDKSAVTVGLASGRPPSDEPASHMTSTGR